MEFGHHGFGQRLYLKRNDIEVNFRTPPATANLGVISLGDGAWDGSSTGKFVGSNLGTIYAANAATGFTGNLLDLQVAGSNKIKLDSSGNLTIAGNLSTTVRAISAGAIAEGAGGGASQGLSNGAGVAFGGVAMSSPNVFFHGPTSTLTDNHTYLCIGYVTVLATATAGKVTAKMGSTGINGSGTIIASGEVNSTASSDCMICLTGVYTALNSGFNNDTMIIDVASTVTGYTIAGVAADNSVGFGGFPGGASQIIVIDLG